MLYWFAPFYHQEENNENWYIFSFFFEKEGTYVNLEPEKEIDNNAANKFYFEKDGNFIITVIEK